ncbi:MAG: phosphoribosylglycinamide formyltransferase [Planctomycetes bacterium]|nr:phosphoribosylglycinamide formyltransferase [Planctomycetota bacterium]
MSAAPRIAVFVSGGGRSLENLALRIAAGELNAQIALVLTNSPRAGALERARRLRLAHVVIDGEKRLSPAEFSLAAFRAAEAAGAELVVLAGFLRLLVIPPAWLGRVLNIHPSLLPAFGGHGFYGHRVHEAVIASGVATSGCTVHYVTNEYDAGPILLQRALEVRRDDTPDTLAARVFEEEKLALPAAIALHLANDPRARAARAALVS